MGLKFVRLIDIIVALISLTEMMMMLINEGRKTRQLQKRWKMMMLSVQCRKMNGA